MIKYKINQLLLLSIFGLLMFWSCQDEEADIDTPNEQETIQPSSPLANLMSMTSANFGGMDDFLDGSSCFSLELPITIIVSNTTIIIESEEDLEQLEDLFDDYEDDDDFLDFVFPITIIFSDYSEIVIENEDQLENFIDNCDDVDDAIECVDFVYPISFSVFNAEFDLLETVIIENDEALYEFLDDLEDDDNALIVSLNYPVTLVYANGDTVEVNSNQELADAISAAGDDCDENDDCNEEELDEILEECYWEVYLYTNDDTENLDGPYIFNFGENGELVIEGITDEPYTTTWELNQTDDGIELYIESFYYYEQQFGSWLVVECDDDDLHLEHLTVDGTGLYFEQSCEDDLDCSVLEIAENLEECQWYIGTSLLSPNYNGPLNFENGGVVSVNTNSGNEVVGTWEVVLGNTGTFLILELPGDYQVISGYWRIVECEDDRLELSLDEQEMVLEQDCETEPDCNQSDVNEYLMSCYIVPTVNGYTSPMTYFQFSENNSLFTMYQGDLPHSGTWDISSDDNGVFIFINFTPFIDQYYNGQWYLQECDDDGLVFHQGDDVLVLACDPNSIGIFDCFENREVLVCDEDNDGFYDFDLNEIYDCPEDNVVWTFHLTLMDAETSTNALVSPFTNYSNPQIIYVRVESAGAPDMFEIFTVELIIEDCSTSCSEEDVDAFLTTCIWNAVNYNGSDNLMNYNFDFEPNSQIVVIYNDETTIDAAWTTSQSDNGVIVTFSNVAGPNIQAITGEWLVVECESDRLEMHQGDNILVLEQDCD